MYLPVPAPPIQAFLCGSYEYQISKLLQQALCHLTISSTWTQSVNNHCWSSNSVFCKWSLKCILCMYACFESLNNSPVLHKCEQSVNFIPTTQKCFKSDFIKVTQKISGRDRNGIHDFWQSAVFYSNSEISSPKCHLYAHCEKLGRRSILGGGGGGPEGQGWVANQNNSPVKWVKIPMPYSLPMWLLPTLAYLTFTTVQKTDQGHPKLISKKVESKWDMSAMKMCSPGYFILADACL